jgi:hypothetical protein
MLCNTVSKRLSEFFDGMLDDEMAFQVSQHLKQCVNCRKELDALSNLHGKLNSLTRIPAPEYLHHLVQTRVLERKNNTWIRQIKDALAFRWSRIRTTEGQFYWTRALGLAMTAFFLFVISSSIDPFYKIGVTQASERSVIDNEYSKSVRNRFSRSIGMLSIDFPEKSYGSTLNTKQLLEFGESATSDWDEDAITGVIEVEPNGAGKIQYVITSPYDRKLLDSFINAIALTRFRPEFRNGQPVSSQLVIKHITTTVYE